MLKSLNTKKLKTCKLRFSAIKAILLKLVEATSHYMTYFSRSFSQSKIDLVHTLKPEVVAVTTPLSN